MTCDAPTSLQRLELLFGAAIVLLGLAIPGASAGHIPSWFFGGGVIWLGFFLVADAVVPE